MKKEDDLNSIMNKIYKKQFHDEDEDFDGNVTCFSEGAEKVLMELQNLKNNPELLSYVIMCLKKINPHESLTKYYKIVIHTDGDITFPKIFNNINEAESFASNIENIKQEIPYFSTHKNNENLLFEKYSIIEV